MERCAPCGATLYGDADWCGQCFAPRRPATPNPFGPRAAQPAQPAPALTPGSGWQNRTPATVFASQNEGTSLAAPPAPSPAPPWSRNLVVDELPVVVPAPVEVRNGKAAKMDEGKVAKPLGAILVLGLLVQGALYLYGRSGDASIASQIRTGQLVILAFYGAVLALVVRMARTVDFQPLWSSGASAENVAVGALKGVAVATGMLLLVSTATGRVQVAPSVKFELGDATLTSVLVALLGMVVAAPVVEELLFRGFVGEAMRHRGHVVALVGSGVLFALWHMRFGPVQILYYTVLGVMLGRTYFKRGLVASMAAHAGFNGTLVLVALVFILGPGGTMSANGVSIHAPGGWDEVDVSEVPEAQGAVLVAHGPSSAILAIVAGPLPPGVTEAAALAYVRQAGTVVATASGVARPGDVRMVTYPAGEALRFAVDQPGNQGEMAVFFSAGQEWRVVLQHGTERSRDDYEEMLQTLRLP